jgi:Ni/Fe-hydrogenase 1 B-type cytochrome subunit
LIQIKARRTAADQIPAKQKEHGMSEFADWVAAAGVDPATVSPLASNTIDQAAYQAMRAFRRPIGTIHLYTFFALSGVILAHLVAVIVTELHEGGSITSAMFTGREIFNRQPKDV